MEQDLGKFGFDEERMPHATGFGGGGLPFLVVTSGSFEVIHVCGNGTGDHPNGSRSMCRLIAAAPDLLEACKAAKKYLEPDLLEPGRTVFWNLVSAIAKVEGRS